MNHFLPDQLHEIKTVFARFDHHGHGYIFSQHLGNVLRILRQDPTAAQLKDLENQFGRCVDGANSYIRVIDFPELLIMLSHELSYGSTAQNRLHAAFKVFDKDNSGLINVSDLRHALTTFGDPLSWAEIDQLLEDSGLPLINKIAYHKIINQLTEAVEKSSSENVTLEVSENSPDIADLDLAFA